MKIRQPHRNSPRNSRRLRVGIVATTVVAVCMPLAANSASALLDPNVGPAAPHSIIVFPARDFVHLDGYQASDTLTVNVVRGGNVVGSTLPFHPDQFDPKAGMFMADINHLGPPCWSGVTPDILGGDVIQVLTSPTTGDQTPTSGVTVTSPATETAPGSGTVVMTGTAPDAAAPGGRTPIDQLNGRIIAKKQLFSNGKRLLRADSIGAKGGVIAYDTPTGNTWTATFTGLNAIAADGVRDADKAVDGESRGQWLGRNPLAVNENTIFEWNLLGGPAAGCDAAPATPTPTVPDMTSPTDSGISALDNVTSNTSPTFVGTTGDPLATSAILYVDSVPNGTATVSAGNYSLTPATPLTDGPHVVQVTETKAPALTESLSKGSLAITVDTIAPVAPGVTAPVSPGFSGSPVLSGTAEAGSMVSLFTNPACTPPVASSGNAAAFGSTGVSAAVTAGSTTSFFAKATDIAGNVSPCSAGTASYTQDSVRPTVLSTTPATNATGAVQAGNMTARFSENVVGVGGATFTLKKSVTNAAVAAAVTYSAATRLATLNPTASLAPGTRYTATLTSGIKDAAGNTVLTSGWSFTTGPRPVITRKTPATNALRVSRVANATATFSENVRGVSRTTFTLKKATGAAVSVSVSYNPSTHVATLNPGVTLAANTRYTARLSSLIKDADGNPITAMSWTFTTGRT
jgi:hypothetical protein